MLVGKYATPVEDGEPVKMKYGLTAAEVIEATWRLPSWSNVATETPLESENVNGLAAIWMAGVVRCVVADTLAPAEIPPLKLAVVPVTAPKVPAPAAVSDEHFTAPTERSGDPVRFVAFPVRVPVMPEDAFSVWHVMLRAEPVMAEEALSVWHVMVLKLSVARAAPVTLLDTFNVSVFKPPVTLVRPAN